MKTKTVLFAMLVVLFAGASAQAASIGITFGDGTQGPALGSPAGPGVVQDYWNNIDVGLWDTCTSHVNARGINIWSGWGPYESGAGAQVATKDSKNNDVNINFLSSNPAQVYSASKNSEWGAFFDPQAGPNTTTYNQQKLAWDPGWKNDTPPYNYATFSGIPYATYDVYIWATGLTLGLVDTGGPYLNGAAVFLNQTGNFNLVGDFGTRTISYIQFVDSLKPILTASPLQFPHSGSDIYFGDVLQDDVATLYSPVTLSNTGDADLHLTDVAVTGGLFGTDPGSFPITLQPTQGQVFDLTFDATGLPLGDVYGTMTFNSDGGSVTYNVHANVISGGGVVPEPAGLGLVGLALLAVRKRRS